MLRRRMLYAALGAVVALVAAGAAPAVPGPSAESPGHQLKVFVMGAAIHGANGLAVDATGRLLVASAFGGELVALDPQTGQILQRLGHAVGVEGPDDVAVGPDGSIYWTDFDVGEVGRLAPDGVTTKQLVGPGVNPIAFSADGRLFVARAFIGDGLYELDPDLVEPPTPVIPPSGLPPFFGQLNGFDFGPDGMLYAPQPLLGRIVRIDPDSGATTLLAQLAEGMIPTSVELDSQGRLHASLVDGTILRVDRSTGAYGVLVVIRNAGNLDNMVFDARDRLFVSDPHAGTVFVVAPGGGVRTLVPGGPILPGGVAVMGDSLFVADAWTLAEFDERSGRLVQTTHATPVGGGIVPPFSVAPDDGNVIVTSWMANAVQIWDPAAGAQVALFSDFAVPLNALRFQGDLVVAELGTGSVARKDETGAKSLIATGLFVPTGLAATDDDLWVADWAMGVVWKLVADGAVLPAPQFTAAGLSRPEGMAVDVDGSLLVVESGAGRLSRIDPLSGAVTTVADGLELGVQGSSAAPPTWALSSVAVGRNGTVFVTADLAGRVYRLRPLPAS